MPLMILRLHKSIAFEAAREVDWTALPGRCPARVAGAVDIPSTAFPFLAGFGVIDVLLFDDFRRGALTLIPLNSTRRCVLAASSFCGPLPYGPGGAGDIGGSEDDPVG
jgi:hypothetical protein